MPDRHSNTYSANVGETATTKRLATAARPRG